ncbi:MAG TPA: hypothetical protein VHL79_08295 [Ramlibacter sp.]|jgi:hypothetical protein|nr:hypothetical protein [Ramlibacter sp.]
MLSKLLNLSAWVREAWAPTQIDQPDTLVMFVVEGTGGSEARDAHAPPATPGAALLS